MDLSRLVTSGGRGRSLSADVLENDTFGRIRPGSLLRAPLSLVPAKINKQERELENNACELENNACELLFNRRELSQRADGPDVAERADELRRFEGFTAQHSSEERGGLAHNSEGVTDDAEVSPRNSAIYTTGEEEEVGLLKEKLSLPAMEDCGTGRAETFRSVELDPSTERPFYCKRCLSAFSSKSNLQVHNRTVHDRQRPYVCEQCNYRFGTKSNRNRHERMVHRNERTYECPHCDKTFGTRSCVRRHCRKIHGEVPTTP